MLLTRSLNGMGINLKSVSQFVGTVALFFLISAPVFSETVDISYQSAGTSAALNTSSGSVDAGLHEITIDGNSSLAVNSSNSRTTGTWTATINSYDDIQNGAGKYNSGRNGKEKYAKAGYLFGLLDLSESLSATAAKYNALVNYVIWDIMGRVPDLNDRSDKRTVRALMKQANQNKGFDWSTTMLVYTADDRRTTREFFAPLPPIATPIPSALFLFGSMVLGLFGIVTRKRVTTD